MVRTSSLVISRPREPSPAAAIFIGALVTLAPPQTQNASFSNAKHNRRNRYHHAASSSASGSGFSTPTATAAAPQILQPSAYHQPQQSRQQNFYSGNGGGAGVTSSSSSAAHRSTSPFQRPNSSANFQAGAAGGVPERYTESPFGGGGGTRAGGVDRTAHQLEGQNNERLEGLLGKVKLLKDVSCRGHRQAIERGGGPGFGRLSPGDARKMSGGWGSGVPCSWSWRGTSSLTFLHPCPIACLSLLVVCLSLFRQHARPSTGSLLTPLPAMVASRIFPSLGRLGVPSAYPAPAHPRTLSAGPRVAAMIDHGRDRRRGPTVEHGVGRYGERHPTPVFDLQQ